MQAKVRNGSSIDIIVQMLPIGGSSNVSSVKISPGKTQAFHVSTGTMILDVQNSNSNQIWRGPVPTFIKDTLVFSDGGISYQGQKIPSESSKSILWNSKWIILIMVLVLVILGLCLWYVRRR